jgi:hypothetical protein
MKKIFFIYAMLCMCSVAIFAQLKVTSDGKVGIGITATPVSKLAVGTVGDTFHSIDFYSDNNTMQIGSNGTFSSWGSLVRTLSIYMNSTSSRIYNGLTVNASKPASASNGRTSGIIAIAGNASSGFNHAVIGSLCGSHNGAGIYGTVNLSQGQGHDAYADGRYAGYFDGNVKVTGTINGTVIGNSDIRLKQNVVELSSSKNVADLNSSKNKTGELNRVISLIPISYNYKQVSHNVSKGDTLQLSRGMFDEKSQMFQKKHFGLIAQDLQKIYPDLVYENDNGYLAINYIELVPLLIQSIKELKEEVDQLAAASINTRSATSNDILAETSRAVLYQNAPNPFSNSTVIKYALPENTTNASIMVFNLQGALVKQFSIDYQQTSITINGSELNAGMYLYSLIIDGKEADTKRMILTK